MLLVYFYHIVPAPQSGVHLSLSHLSHEAARTPLRESRGALIAVFCHHVLKVSSFSAAIRRVQTVRDVKL